MPCLIATGQWHVYVKQHLSSCGCQTSRTNRSVIREDWLLSASLTASFCFTWFQASAARSPNASFTSFCRCNTTPPFLQSKAWSKLNEAPHPSKWPGIVCSGFLYLITRACLDSWGDKSNWCLLMDKHKTVSHDEMFSWFAHSIALWCRGSSWDIILEEVPFWILIFSTRASLLISCNRLTWALFS